MQRNQKGTFKVMLEIDLTLPDRTAPQNLVCSIEPSGRAPIESVESVCKRAGILNESSQQQVRPEFRPWILYVEQFKMDFREVVNSLRMQLQCKVKK